MPSVTPRTWRGETHAHCQLCPEYRFPILALLQYKGKGKVIKSLKGKVCSHLGRGGKAFPTKASH